MHKNASPFTQHHSQCSQPVGSAVSYCDVPLAVCVTLHPEHGANAELGVCLPPELHVRNIMHPGKHKVLGAKTFTQYVCYTEKPIFSSYALQITN